MRTGNYLTQSRYHCLGFTYIGLMLMIAISGIILSSVGIVWHQDVQREREKELLFVGDAYRKAIGSYYENSPTAVKQYPRKLDELILDTRFPNIKRHLRKLYTDPLERDAKWGLVMQKDQIIGVYSQSILKPIKRRGFLVDYAFFKDAKEYKDWKFIYGQSS